MSLKPPLVDGGRSPRQAREGIAVDALELNPLASLPSDAADGTICTSADGSVYSRVGGQWKILAGGVGIDGSYNNPTYPALTTIAGALDYLLYVPVAGTGLAVSPPTAEVGQAVSSVLLSWGYTLPVTTQSVSGPGAVPLTVADRSKTLTGIGLTSTTAYSVTGSDGKTTVTQSASIQFLRRRFWDVSFLSSVSPDNLANSELTSTRTQSKTFNASGQYIYFAWPSSFGTPTFTINGLLNTAWVKSTMSRTNGYGYVENYDVYRSQYLQTGSITVSVA